MNADIIYRSTTFRHCSFSSGGGTRSKARQGAALRIRAEEDGRQFDRKFDEGAQQVKRLLNRDKLELMGVQEIGAALRSEFDEENKAVAEVPWEQTEYGGASVKPDNGAPPAQPAGQAKPANNSNPFGAGSSSSAASPFGPSTSNRIPAAKSPAGPANPFGAPPSTPKPFSEPAGLSPFQRPDEEEEQPWYKQITFTQVVIALSFVLTISLTLATFVIVAKSGAIRLNSD